MTEHYSLDYFKNNSTLYNLASRYDSNTEGGNNDRILNGNEIKLFTTELKKRGINFDFTKLSDTDYLGNIDKTYQKEVEYSKKRENLIEEMKDNYSITKFKDNNGNVFYKITAKKDIILSQLKDDLKIPAGVVSEYNHGYGKWDNGGHHIENKSMKGITIQIPENQLGAKQSLGESLYNWFMGFFE